jgi:hypothetical protein
VAEAVSSRPGEGLERLLPRRVSGMPFAAGFCHTVPERLGTTVPGPACSVDSVLDLTCFRNGAYRAKGVPGTPVNDPAKKSPDVAVLRTARCRPAPSSRPIAITNRAEIDAESEWSAMVQREMEFRGSGD